jgi:hypothetical protein
LDILHNQKNDLFLINLNNLIPTDRRKSRIF